MIEAVIFDLDGTLIDSIPFFLEAYARGIRSEFGIEPDRDVIRRQFGKSSGDIVVGVLEEMRIKASKADIEDLLAGIRMEFAQRIRDVTMLPGAHIALERLKGRYPLALATSSKRYYTEGVMEKFGLARYFDAVVTSDNVLKAKPAPDIFLKAAEMLKKGPAECLVFEDAAFGVMAARAAGMKAVAVTTGSSSRGELEEAGADAIIEGLDRFDPRMLKSL